MKEELKNGLFNYEKTGNPIYSVSKSLVSELYKIDKTIDLTELGEVGALFLMNDKHSPVFAWSIKFIPLNEKVKFGFKQILKTGETVDSSDISEDEFIDIRDLFGRLFYYIQNRDSLVGTKNIYKYRNAPYINCKVKHFLVDHEYLKHLNQKKWEVTGHYRMQACGPGLKDRKRIWVSEHEKGHKSFK